MSEIQHSLPTILLSGIGAVTAALVFVCRILWQRSEKCELVRDEQSKQIGALLRETGEVRGMLSVMAACPSQECPIPHSMRVSFLKQQSTQSTQFE